MIASSFLAAAAISPIPPDESAIVIRQHTFMGWWSETGPFGMPTLLASLALVCGGLVLLINRGNSHLRTGYSILTLVPAIIGLTGSIIGCLKAFSNLGRSGLADGEGLMRALSEVSESFVSGLFGSAMAMTFAVLVWLLPERKSVEPPPLK